MLASAMRPGVEKLARFRVPKIGGVLAHYCAAAAYWIYERERAEDLIVALLPRARRKTVRDLWDLVELKLGAYVRASLLLIGFVATVLSVAFWAIGLPYWLLLGLLCGILEIIPIVGPLLAGIASVGVALTV